MRVLLDESVARDLGDHLQEHSVSTVRDEGWQGESNGALLRVASSRFDVFLTADQNLPHQQNLSQFTIGVVILVARQNRLMDYLPLLPLLKEALESVRPGEAIRVAL